MGEKARNDEPDDGVVADPEDAFRSWLQAAADAAALALGRKAAYPALAELVSRREVLRQQAKSRDPRVPDALRRKADAVAGGLEAATQSWSKDAYLRRWFTSGLPRRPDSDILASVVRVITEVLQVPTPHDVGSWTDFGVLIDELVRRRAADARRRTSADQERMALARADTLGGILVVPPRAERQTCRRPTWTSGLGRSAATFRRMCPAAQTSTLPGR